MSLVKESMLLSMWKKLVPPVLALVGSGAYLAWRQDELSKLSHFNEKLVVRIQHRESSLNSRSGDETSLSTREEEESDLQALLTDGGVRSQVVFENRILHSSASDLVELANQIDASGVSVEEKRKALNSVLVRLNQANPELSLETAFSLSSVPPRVLTIHPAYRHWLNQDPQKAFAWFDEKVLSGAFEGKGFYGQRSLFNLFEATALGTVAEVDPKLANERLSRIPAAERVEVFTSLSLASQTIEPHAVAVTSVAEQSLESQEFTDVVERFSRTLARASGLDTAANYLAGIQTNELPRLAKVALNERAVSHAMDTEMIDELRGFAERMVPEESSFAVGAALAGARKVNDLTELRVMIEKEYSESPDDSLLFGFLENLPKRELQLVSGLIERIEDSSTREVLRNKLTAQ